MKKLKNKEFIKGNKILIQKIKKIQKSTLLFIYKGKTFKSLVRFYFQRKKIPEFKEFKFINTFQIKN